MRSQYLGFFFTAVLGVVAFAGPRLASDSLKQLNGVLDFYEQQIVAMNRWISTAAALDSSSFDEFVRTGRPWASHERLSERVFQVSLFTFFVVSWIVFVRATELSSSPVTSWACGAGVVLTAAAAVFAWLGRTSAENRPTEAAG